jgi:hypothetical protein
MKCGAVAESNGERHDRRAVVGMVGVAQQGIAAEAAKQVSHLCRSAVRGPAERERWAPLPHSQGSEMSLPDG